MNTIAVLTDEDFGLEPQELLEPKIRKASRGIVIRNVYSSKFVALRDRKILEYYLANK